MTLRHGFTTGSCAAAASKAAAYMLLTGREKTQITIDTPKGIPYHAQVECIRRNEDWVQCAVQKDGGDDPDITTGAYVEAAVRMQTYEGTVPTVVIDGGKGVGRITRQGLDQPVGNAAINRVPRAMIEKEVLEVCKVLDFTGCLEVVIAVPEGEELAKRTFNPRLGIIGGISILGTTGIVEPMSVQALLDTILVELKMRKAEGHRILAISPGNYGLEFMKKTYGYDLEASVKCSNYIGDTIDMAIEQGFATILLTGHIGKLVKLAGGMMNTHSHEGDCRMELLMAAAVEAGADGDTARAILQCLVSEEAIPLLQKAQLFEATMEQLGKRITYYLNKRSQGKVRIEWIIYANAYGELVKSAGAAEVLKQLNVLANT